MCNEETVTKQFDLLSTQILIACTSVMLLIVLIFFVIDSMSYSRYKQLGNKIDSLQLKVGQLQPYNLRYVSPTNRGN